MPAGRTYTPIARTTADGTSSSITFSSIPGTYTDLILVAQVKGAASGYPQVTINGSSANLSRLWLVGNGSTASSSKASDNYITGTIQWNTADFAFSSITHIQNYANTTTYKTLLTRVNNASSAVEAVVNTWRSTSAITSIAYVSSNGNFAFGSTFTLYGIAAA